MNFLRRITALTALFLLVSFTIAVCAFSFIDRFQQVDTLPKNTTETPEAVKLMRVLSEKTKEGEAKKDSISQSISEIGVLKVQADRINVKFNTAIINFKEAATTEKDVQPIEKIYRIDTSPRPVVIQVVNPSFETVKPKKGLFQRRKEDQ